MRKYNKLVRDNIPEIIRNNGENPICQTLSEEEYKTELDKKLLEEVSEYLESDSTLELADIYEVLISILKLKNLTLKQLEEIARLKREKNGGFEKRIFLKEVIK